MEKNLIQQRLQEVERLMKNANSKEELLFLIGAKEALMPFRYILRLQDSIDEMAKSTRKGLENLSSIEIMNFFRLEKIVEFLETPVSVPSRPPNNHYQTHWLGGRR